MIQNIKLFLIGKKLFYGRKLSFISNYLRREIYPLTANIREQKLIPGQQFFLQKGIYPWTEIIQEHTDLESKSIYVLIEFYLWK